MQKVWEFTEQKKHEGAVPNTFLAGLCTVVWSSAVTAWYHPLGLESAG